MTKDEIREKILNLGHKSNCILAELPTSIGKSRIALDFIHEKQFTGNILIVIPRIVLIDNWKKEFVKWGYESYLKQTTFTTYRSLHKHVTKKFNLVVFDECHHLSERARETAEDLSSDYYLLLSATVNRALKKEIKILFPNLISYHLTVKEAIDEEILPDPKVFLVPLQLDNTELSETLIYHPKAKGPTVEETFANRFKAKKDKTRKYVIKCTQLQYYTEISAMATYYKNKYFYSNNEILYFKWQQESKKRLMWLASLKDKFVLKLLEELKNKRTLTFCNGIEQTEKLGQYCINSKNSESDKYLEDFNNGKINHITACNMLDEGVNLVNCQVGIFVNINSSDTMRIQKLGRILRHSDPMLYYLYYKNTREEEIIKESLSQYNQELITVVKKNN